MEFTRYAIYVLPAAGPLAAFSAGWLGWDAVTGRMPAPPDLGGLPLPRAEITEAPRRYGFHGTIKPPFRLAEGQDADALQSALGEFCACHAPLVLSGLALTRMGRFLALVPKGDVSGLARLAAGAVRDLDRFRAPPTEAELARRRAAGLSPGQAGMLARWGYPYVLDEFRFHLTLTARLPKEHIAPVEEALDEQLAPLLDAPFPIDALCLVGEAPDGRFHQIARCPLSDAA